MPAVLLVDLQFNFLQLGFVVVQLSAVFGGDLQLRLAVCTLAPLKIHGVSHDAEPKY